MTGTSAKIIPLPLTQLKCRALLKGPIFALHCDRMECKDTAVTLQGRQGQKNAPINKWTQQALVLPWIPSFFSEGVPCWAAWCERLIQFLAVKKSQILTYFTLSADAALLVFTATGNFCSAGLVWCTLAAFLPIIQQILRKFSANLTQAWLLQFAGKFCWVKAGNCLHRNEPTPTVRLSQGAGYVHTFTCK